MLQIKMEIVKKIVRKIKIFTIKQKIKNFFKKLWVAIYKTVFTFNLHNGTLEAESLAYSMLFAIFPFMIFFTLLLGYIGQTDIGIKFIEIAETTLPEYIVKTLLPVIDNVVNGPKSSIISIASLTLIWSASSLVQNLKNILDKSSRIKHRKSYFFRRSISMLQFLLMTILIISLIFITIIFPKMIQLIDKFIPLNFLNKFFDINFIFHDILILLKPLFLSLFLFIFIFSVYYIIPSKREKFRNIIWGSLFTLIGWSLMLKILTFYLQKMAKFQVVYGSLAGIIITLFFFYLMAIIFIFGAEFNHNLKETFNTK